MKKIPDIKELEKRFSSCLENEALKKISSWRLENTDTPTDEEKYLDKALKNVSGMKTLLKDGLKEI